jgi:transcriptional regulator with XRE-family HTH domain
MRNRKTDHSSTRAQRAGFRKVAGAPTTEIQRAVLLASGQYTADVSDLARDMGVADITLSSWRRGARRPSAERLRSMAASLGRKASKLVAQQAWLEIVADAMEDPEGARLLQASDDTYVREGSAPRTDRMRAAEHRDRVWAEIRAAAGRVRQARRTEGGVAPRNPG